MKTKINYPAILTFFVVAIAIRYITNKTSLLTGVENEYFRIIIQGIGPAIGAIIAFMLFDIKPVMTFKGTFKNLSIPLLIFWALPIILITTVAYLTKGTLPYMAIFSILIYALLEEIGWRGFLQQSLKSLPKSASILIVALLWFIWHLNFDLSSANLTFFGILVLGSWGIGKVADQTNSLLAVAGFHALNDFFGTLDTTKSLILVTLIVVWILVIILKDKLEQKTLVQQVGIVNSN